MSPSEEYEYHKQTAYCQALDDYDVVYAIGNSDYGCIKIGRTNKLRKRLGTFRANSPIPLSLLAVMFGDKKTESTIHLAMQSHRSHGEWFERTPEVERLVEFMASMDIEGLVEHLGQVASKTPALAQSTKLALSLDRMLEVHKRSAQEAA